MQHRSSPRDYRSSYTQQRIQNEPVNNPQTQTPLKAVTSRRRPSASPQTNNTSSTTALALGLLMFSGSMIGVHATITTASAPQSSPQRTTEGSRTSTSSRAKCSPNPELARKINETCSAMPFRSYNRAAKVRLDLVKSTDNRFQKQSDYVPEPCAENLRKGEAKSETCKQQEQQLKSGSIIYHPILKQMRSEIQQAYKETSRRVVSEIENILSHHPFNQHQLNKVNILYDKLSKLQENFIAHKEAVSEKYGNCGEYEAHNAIRSLQFASNAQETVRIQSVHLDNEHFNHAFLLINSDTPDVEMNDPAQITKHLRTLKQFTGNICDAWNGDSQNRGYYQRLSRNRNGLYNEISKWDSLKITTLSLNFDYDGLPREIGEFFDKELKALGLRNQQGKPLVCLHDDEQEPEEDRVIARRNEL